MNWEAYRWTAKSPSELLHVLGPHGVDDLVRQALNTCWRESPEEGRSFDSVRKIAREVFDRNIKVWKSIKKPSPAAFFENLLPRAADQFIRQAMVTCWMMMPRTGGRHVSDVVRIITDIFERNMTAWEQDNRTFTSSGKKPRPTRKVSKPRAAPARSTGKKKSKPRKR